MSGCGPSFKQVRYKQALTEWIGQDANRLFEVMGPPDSQFVLPNGNTMHTWVNYGATRTVAYGGGAWAAASSSTARCKTIFTTTPDGRVDAVRSEGTCSVGKKT